MKHPTLMSILNMNDVKKYYSTCTKNMAVIEPGWRLP